MEAAEGAQTQLAQLSLAVEAQVAAVGKKEGHQQVLRCPRLSRLLLVGQQGLKEAT